MMHCISFSSFRKNRIPLQDGELLAEATLLRQIELLPLRGSVTKLQILDKTNSRAKNLSPASVNIHCEDDGTVSSCSFVILPQRQLPQPPSVDLISPEETYSNLTFPEQTQEVLYEAVDLKEDKWGEPSSVAAKGKEDHSVADGYAKVQKRKKKKNAAETEGMPKQALQESSPTETASAPSTLKLEEMYAVVCKEKKKKGKNGVVLGENRRPQVETSHGNCHVASLAQGSDGMAEHPSSLFQPHMIEPCYESVSCESWADVGKKETEEPAYETVDTHWKKPRKKRKSKNNTAAENLYESIDNLAFQF
ncbi:uncharacterized protein LOC121929990 isoform X2 [Sceloporus undulatus]|uniref:uncharacterized protein LOC121929990 isoform X2 n=1 Tax=Sceloporus undulatus TaxID=8520 RepID=UPI001C4CF1C8|nr:uncharacterized protein LOC121929990 isoform X2 [Sceloporus undulatus]